MDDNERILNDLIANNFSDLVPGLTASNILIVSHQVGAGTEPQPDGETDQDLVPEQEDEVQEGDEDEGCGHRERGTPTTGQALLLPTAGRRWRHPQSGVWQGKGGGRTPQPDDRRHGCPPAWLCSGAGIVFCLRLARPMRHYGVA